MIFAVIDTNVFVSGLINQDNPPGRILKLIYEGKVVPIITDEIYDEITRVLNYDRFKFRAETKKGILDFLKNRILKISLPVRRITGIPEYDMKFVAAAGASGANLIVTGNIRHFGAVSEKFTVLTPAEFILKTAYYSI